MSIATCRKIIIILKDLQLQFEAYLIIKNMARSDAINLFKMKKLLEIVILGLNKATT